MKTNEIYVSFHVGRGGSSHNPGYITFIAEIDFQELIAKRSDNLILCDTIWDEENDKEVALADKDWQLVDTGSNVILKGRKDIEAKKGVLEFDTIYDKDYTCTLDECDEKEWDALRYAYEKPLERFDMSEDLQREIREYFDLDEDDDDELTSDDITEDDLLGGVATFNSDAFCIDTDDLASEVYKQIEEFGFEAITDDEDIAVARDQLELDDDDERTIYKSGAFADLKFVFPTTRYNDL